MTKTCTKCGETFPATPEYFNRCKHIIEGLRPRCKSCHHEDNREYRKRNREKISEYARQYQKKNPERYREACRRQRRENPEYARMKRERHRRYRESPFCKINSAISGRIHQSLKGSKGGRPWESLVGYTLADLISHLERQFSKGMTWENYGRNGWHVDHIRPISHFEFSSTDDPQFKECWSLWNLQPMWESENISKGAKCDEPPLPLLHGD